MINKLLGNTLGTLSNTKVTSKKVNEIIDSINNAGIDYKVYTALVTQTGTNKPTVVVLKNTIGNVTWTYDNVGYYSINKIGAFTVSKVWSSIGAIQGNVAGVYGTTEVIPNITADSIQISTTRLSTGNPVNDQLVSTPIEIRIYK